MRLPALIPDSLKHYQVCDDQEELLLTLKKYRDEIIPFFEIAAEDETWCEEHPHFMKLFLEWVTKEFLDERVSHAEAKAVQKMVHKHQRVLLPLVNHDWKLKSDEADFEINSLLFGIASDAFYDYLRWAVSKKKREYQLNEIPTKYVRQVIEYLNTGNIAHIWRNDQEELLEFHLLAQSWGLGDVVEMCQKTLERYIDRDNVYTLLKETHRDHWIHLRRSCMQYLNGYHWGVVFHDSDPESLVFEFLDWRDDAIDLFENVKEIITHLLIGGDLAEEPEFVQVVHQCPNLRCLDLSRSRAFVENYREIPSTLPELNLSGCVWLNDQCLKEMITICPQLKKLSLRSDTQLTYRGFGDLIRLRGLEYLDLTHCQQIKDQEFRLIFRATPQLETLICEGCTGITDISFMEYARTNPNLLTLNLARTNISNAALVALVSSAPRLQELDLTRTENLSDRALLEAVRASRSLKRVVLSSTKVTKETLELIHEARPYVRLEV